MKIVKKIKDWFWKLFIAYNEYKTKKFERHNCSRCGARHLFDVPIDVPIERVEFVCTKCCKKSEPYIVEIKSVSVVKVPVNLFPDCEHVRGSIILKDDVMYCECKICGKLY